MHTVITAKIHPLEAGAVIAKSGVQAAIGVEAGDERIIFASVAAGEAGDDDLAVRLYRGGIGGVEDVAHCPGRALGAEGRVGQAASVKAGDDDIAKSAG